MSVRIMGMVFESKLPPVERLVALALADHAHDDGTRVWPSVAALAEKVGLGTTATRSALRRLEGVGVIETVRPGGGRHRPTEYRFTPTWLNATLGAGFPQGDSAPGVGFPEGASPTPTPRKRNADAPETQRAGVAEPSEPQTSEPEPSRSSAARARETTILPPSAFDAFWQSYPRRTGKGAARKAFDAAILKTSATELIAAACRFRDDPNRDPTYTPHPATWLNQERWGDDPLPPKQRDRAMELIAEAMTEGYGDGHDAGEGDPGDGDGVLPAPAPAQHRGRLEGGAG